MAVSQPFLWRSGPDGRAISWRAWVLIWVAPVLFLLAGLLMLTIETYRHLATVPGEGEVVRVYEWEGGTIFDRGVPLYGPVFRYVWSDGQPTEATSGMSHPDWRFEIGSIHDIRYFPGAKRNVVYPGPHNWAPALVVGGIGLALLAPALWGTLRLRRWQRGAA